MENSSEMRIITLKDLWDIFVHRLWIIALAAVVCAAGFLTVDKITYVPEYSSTATLYILRQNAKEDEDITAGDATNDYNLALKVVNDCSYIIKSHTVLDQAAEQLDLDIKYDKFVESITINNPTDTRVLEVTVAAESPEQAKKIVDSVCNIAAVEIEKAMGYKQVTFYENGILEQEPSNKTSVLMYLVAGVIGAVLAYAVFLVMFLLDDTIKTEDDVQKYLGLSLLGDIPDSEVKKKKYGYYSHYGNKYGYGYGHTGAQQKTETAKKEEK